MTEKISLSTASLHSKFFFIWQYLRKPFGIGAIAPSGQKLAKMMVDQAHLQPDDIVIELGPGTGAFTREILARGVKPENLILVEMHSAFVKYLRQHYPEVRVVESTAADLVEIVASLGFAHVDKVISGIPFRSLKETDRQAIIKAVSKVMRVGAIGVQFSYFKVEPWPRQLAIAKNLSVQLSGFVLSNKPPAYVWSYRKTAAK